MDDGEIEDAAAAAVDMPADPPPPPPPGVELLPGAVVDEHRVELPVPPPVAAASWFQDPLTMKLLILTAAIMGFLLIYDKGCNPLAWWGEFAAMNSAQWLTAFFLAVGDVASLGLIYSPSASFGAMWTEGGGGAGVAVLVPPLAGAVNNAVWFVYGMVVEGKNVSVIIVNLVGVLFNARYSIIFLRRASTWRISMFAWISVAVAITVVAAIAAVDYWFLIKTCGWDVPKAVGRSGAGTGSAMYIFGACSAMWAAMVNRGAGGLPAQAVAAFGNALVWFAYACVEKDWSMKIPNSIGILSSCSRQGSWPSSG